MKMYRRLISRVIINRTRNCSINKKNQVLILLSTLMISACSDYYEPILRGVKKVPDQPDVKAQEEAIVSQKKDDLPLNYQPIKDVEKYKKERKPLNLTLPNMHWGALDGDSLNYGVLPDVFRPLPSDQRLNLSGRLYWDESEDSEKLSVEDSIMGAEVELKFYLP